MLARYRATGADLPFGDPRRAHGVAMEGYFWRLTDPRTRRVIVALCGINRDRFGRSWAIVGLAAFPDGFLRHAVLPVGEADAHGLGIRAGDGAFRAGPDRLTVDLGPDARLDVALSEQARWPRRAFGGLGAAHALPGLSQYWHPHALGGCATGTAVLGGVPVGLAGVRVYAEKNWSRTGFPQQWWWGQADGFGEDACVAFAGGDVGLGPVHLRATALVVRVGEDTVRLGNPVVSPVVARVDGDRWLLRGRSLRHRVEVEGWAPLGDAYLLPIPVPAERRNVLGAVQHLGASMRVVVRRRGRVQFSGESALAGLEHGGDGPAATELARREAVGLAA